MHHRRAAAELTRPAKRPESDYLALRYLAVNLAKEHHLCSKDFARGKFLTEIACGEDYGHLVAREPCEAFKGVSRNSSTHWRPVVPRHVRAVRTDQTVRRERARARPPTAMPASPSTTAAAAPTTPLPEPGPPVATARLSPPLTEAISPTATATRAPNLP